MGFSEGNRAALKDFIRAKPEGNPEEPNINLLIIFYQFECPFSSFFLIRLVFCVVRWSCLLYYESLSLPKRDTAQD